MVVVAACEGAPTRRPRRAGSHPAAPLVRDEDKEAEAAYQEALTAALRESEEEKAAQGGGVGLLGTPGGGHDALRCRQLHRASVDPPSRAKPESGLPIRETYVWDGVVREWVSAPPIWLGAMPTQDQLYLKHSRQRRLVEEGLEGRRLKELEREAEAEEEERRARAQPAVLQPPTGDVSAAWETAFP
ncbi:Pre-mRNA-processing factor 39 [Hordeum vulgare]|nr:Pre-mRNA-processing factor 39 [Hordeum vulgare]